jgi:hypothetical protein
MNRKENMKYISRNIEAWNLDGHTTNRVPRTRNTLLLYQRTSECDHTLKKRVDK